MKATITVGNITVSTDRDLIVDCLRTTMGPSPTPLHSPKYKKKPL